VHEGEILSATNNATYTFCMCRWQMVVRDIGCFYGNNCLALSSRVNGQSLPNFMRWSPCQKFDSCPRVSFVDSISLRRNWIIDVTNDVGVAARDAGIPDAGFVRLRRAIDRVACAQTVLETMREGSVGASDEETALRVRMREAVDLLARKAAALHYARAWLHHPFVAEPDQHAGRSHHV
jgi:hypothetical protein